MANASIQSFGGGPVWREKGPGPMDYAGQFFSNLIKAETSKKQAELEHRKAMEKEIAREKYLKDYYDAMADKARAEADWARGVLPANKKEEKGDNNNNNKTWDWKEFLNTVVSNTSMGLGETAKQGSQAVRQIKADKGQYGATTQLLSTLSDVQKKALRNILNNPRDPRYSDWASQIRTMGSNTDAVLEALNRS